MNNNLFEKLIKSELINKVELELLIREGKSQKEILDLVYGHIELTLLTEKELTLPNCVKDLILAKNKEINPKENNEKGDISIVGVNDMLLDKNNFIDDKEYLELVKNEKIKNISKELYYHFCWQVFMKIEGIKELTVKQCKDYVSELSNTLSTEDFDRKLNNIKIN